jgi:hypothetical protein
LLSPSFEILEGGCDELTWLSQAMHWSCVHVSGSMSTTLASQHTSSSTFEYQNLLTGSPIVKPRCRKIHTTSRIRTRKQVLSPDAPRSNTRDKRRKSEEGSLASSALGRLSDQYTHNVYQVPGPEVTYTLARCTIEGSRHVEVVSRIEL